jgi:hypothetical protein
MVRAGRAIYTADMKKPSMDRTERVEDGAEEELLAIDAYEELAVFFDEENPMDLVSLGRISADRAISNP